MPKHIALSLCAVLLLTGCLAPGRPVFPAPPTLVPGAILPFEVVMQESQSLYTGREPALYLVTSLADAQVVADLLDESEGMATQRAQYPEEFVGSVRRSEQFLGWVEQLKAGQLLLALFREPQGMQGYAIRTYRVVLQGDTLYVYAALCHPLMGGATESQYFQIVQVALPLDAPSTADLKPVLVAYDVNC